jgi:DtxR family Mn-dependent transcriptional regulator
MKISESIETYLKQIFFISQMSEWVRSIDVASNLNVSKASVNRAVKKLSEEGYINHQPYGQIFLTDIGKKKAEELCLKQEIVAQYLMKTLFLDEAFAFEEACKIEHVISQRLVKRIKEVFY